MVSKKKRTQIQESLQSLSKTDTYSLLLFTLFKMQNDPKYATLSELCYVLDGDNLSKMLSYYGGMTIKIPTLRDMKLMTQALLLYQYVNLDGGDLQESLQVICGTEYKPDELKEVYEKLVEVVANYDFKRS